MKNQNLIQDLANDLKPVTPIASSQKMYIMMSIAAFAIFALMISFFQPYQGYSLKDPSSFLDLSLATTLFISSMMILNKLRYPSYKIKSNQLFLILIVYVAYILLHLTQILYYITTQKAFQNALLLECSETTLITSIAIGIAYFFMIKEAAITKPLLTSFILATASFSIGLIQINIHCSIQNSLHILISHFTIPFIITSTLSLALSKKLFKW